MSKRIKLIHVPVYENDIILQNLPPSMASQWARGLLIQQLSGGGGGIAPEVLQKALNSALEPLLEQVGIAPEVLEKALFNALEPLLIKVDAVLDDKLDAVREQIVKAVGSVTKVQSKAPVPTPAPVQEPEPEPEEEEIPAWQKSLSKGIRE